MHHEAGSEEQNDMSVEKSDDANEVESKSLSIRGSVALPEFSWEAQQGKFWFGHR